MASINPQGYILGGDPVNTNPFWTDEDSGSSGSSSDGSASSEELEAIETRVETLEEETSTIKTEVGELGDELNELNGEVNTLTTQVNTNTENIASIETNLTSLETELNSKLESATISYSDNTLTLTTSDGSNTYTSTAMISTDYSGVESVTLTTDEETNTNFNINTLCVENEETIKYTTFNTVKETVISQILSDTGENTTNITNLENDKVDDVVLSTDSETSEDYDTHTLSVTKGDTTTNYTLETVKSSSYESLSEDVAENTNSLATLIDGNGGEVGQIWTVQEDGSGGWSNFPDGLIQFTYDTTGKTTLKVLSVLIPESEDSTITLPSYFLSYVNTVDLNNIGGVYRGDGILFRGLNIYPDGTYIVSPPDPLVIETAGTQCLYSVFIAEDINLDLTATNSYVNLLTNSYLYAEVSGSIDVNELRMSLVKFNEGGKLTATITATEITDFLNTSYFAENFVVPVINTDTVNGCLAYVDTDCVIDARNLPLDAVYSDTCFCGSSTSSLSIILPDLTNLGDDILFYVDKLYCSAAMYVILEDMGLMVTGEPSSQPLTCGEWINTDDEGWASDLDGIEE